MISVRLEGWKRALEGQRRGDVGPFRQQNRVEGKHGIREYFDGKTVVMRMCVFESETEKPGYLCDRSFEVSKSIVDATDYIYVPTDEDIEVWGESDLDIVAEIAKREPRI